MVKLKGKWVKGDYWLMDSKKMEKAFSLAGKGVKKPTAIEYNKDKTAWRMYYKPIQPGEFWD